MADPNRCLRCKLHKNNPLAITSVCKHEYDTTAVVEKPKQKPKEVWLPYCPFCSTKILPPKTFYEDDGSVICTMGISHPCQFIGENELCCLCLVCFLHLHLNAVRPKLVEAGETHHSESKHGTSI